MIDGVKYKLHFGSCKYLNQWSSPWHSRSAVGPFPFTPSLSLASQRAMGLMPT